MRIETSEDPSAVRTLKANLRNPSSVDWASVYTNEDGTVVCIILQAQNGFGGISVERYVSVDQKLRDESPLLEQEMRRRWLLRLHAVDTAD
jgi:hypothetical protein